MAEILVSGNTQGTAGDDIFIIDKNYHGYDSIYSESGSDRYYLALDVDALGKTPHDLPEGGGQPGILFDLNDYVILPEGVTGSVLTFWNYMIGHDNPPYGYKSSSLEIVYDPHKLYEYLFYHGDYAKRFGLIDFDKENFVGYGVSTYGGVYGHPDAVSAWNLRTTNSEEYEMSKNEYEQELRTRITQRPTWKYETDRIAHISIKTEDIKDDPSFPDLGWIKKRILLSDGRPAFDLNGNPIGNFANYVLQGGSALRFDRNLNAINIANQIIGLSATSEKVTRETNNDVWVDVLASTWSNMVQVNSVGKASSKGDRVDATQIDFGKGRQGSVLVGDSGNDILWGRAGWDIIDGRDGDDLIRAGNGRDIITGGNGRDEMHGDFGWNTFTSSKDGFSDLIVVKSDQHMDNWLLGGSGHNPDGSKCDIIEGLDTIDKIKILGVGTSDLSFSASATAHGVTGIGIYAKGALEALYTGGDLSLEQIVQMTTGDLTGPANGSYGDWR